MTPNSPTTLIRGGHVVSTSGAFASDIYIEGESISLMGTSIDRTADRVIDATGKLVLPGAIDPHTHMESEAFGTTSCDDFTSGTVAAAHGGTTCIVDFAAQYPGSSLPAAIEAYHEKLERHGPVIDVGFHLMITDLDYPGSLEDLGELTRRGVTSFKFFMAYKDFAMVNDETLLKAMIAARDTGGLVMVHAENGDLVEVLQEQAWAAGGRTPEWHAWSRPPDAEAEATQRAIRLAHAVGAPLYVVHVSCIDALAAVAQARERGWKTWAETCTQYLFVDESALGEGGFEGAKYVFTPPPRGERDREALWGAIGSGDLQVVSSDHSPWKWETQKSLGREDFRKIPNGAPGVEQRMSMLYEHGVRTDRISLSRMVALTSTNPAKLFGLYPAKGAVQVGSDADLVVWNPEKPGVISASTHHSEVDYNLYEGQELSGGPDVVMVRGEVVVENGELKVEPGFGRFVPRAPFGA